MDSDYQSAVSYSGLSKLEILFGPNVWSEVQDKVVIDYGCGHGNELVEIAQHGAQRVIGIDTREKSIRLAKENATKAGLSHLCEFTGVGQKQQSAQDIPPADVIFSLDAFEHYDNPGEILNQMRKLLKPDGRVLICFGPPWLHPYGGHLFSIFPWSHILFTENAQIRWRSDFKSDGAKRFHEVDGGLNQMTIRQFKKLVEQSEFKMEHFEAVPIRNLRYISNPLTQEFTTSVVRCTLVVKN
jgi:SAM-dependent methyltransferase